MPDIEDVLADAQREIKAIGDNVKSLKDTTDKSLADVRKLVEDTPKAMAGSDQFKKDVEALIAGVLEKHEAISARVKALTETTLSSATTRMDDIEKKLNRGKLEMLPSHTDLQPAPSRGRPSSMGVRADLRRMPDPPGHGSG